MPAPHRRPCDTPEAQAPSLPYKTDTRWVLPATILGSSLGYVDESMVNVALPLMQRDLGTSFAGMQWVFNGYMLTLASLLLLGGSAGDRFDRRKMFLIGLGGFAAASIASGLAPSAGWLIGARMAQGAAAALLMPVSLAIVGAAYGGKERGRAIGIWLAAGTLAIAVSRPLGGWLVDSFGWRAIFFVNVPLAAAAFVCGLGLARDKVRERREPLDTRGALLAILALGLLSYGLIALGRGERAVGIATAAASVPLFWLFLSAEGRARGAMMPLSLFRNVSFAGANALTFLYYAALSAVFFMLPYVMIDVHGYSAAAAGAAFLPLSAIMAAGSPFSGALVERAGPRATLVAGSALTAAGYLLLAASGTIASYATGFLPGLVVVGIGVTLSVAPLTTAVFDSAPDDQTGAASGINNAVDVTGGLVAVAALGLAFGGAEIGGMEGPTLVSAYQVVAVAGAVLAGLSGVVAGVTIGGRGQEMRLTQYCRESASRSVEECKSGKSGCPAGKLAQNESDSRSIGDRVLVMLLREIVRAEKDVADWGAGADGTKMTRAAFPLTRQRDRSYRLPSYRWRLVRFRACQESFRLLIVYRTDKEQYRAILALEHARDMSVLAQYEFHGTHPGWHLLASCDSEGCPAGCLRHPRQIRMPPSRAFHRNVEFGVKNDAEAFARANQFFRLHKAEGALL